MSKTSDPRNSYTQSQPTPRMGKNFTHEMRRGQLLIALWCSFSTLFLDVGPRIRVHSAHGRNLSEGTFVRCVS